MTAVGIAAYYFGRTNPSFANIFGGTANLDWLANIIVYVHAAEASAMFIYSLYRGADVVTTAKWTVTQLFIGFPTYFQFKKVNK